MSKYHPSCDICGAPIPAGTGDRFELPLSGGSPYPDNLACCDNPECFKAAEERSGKVWDEAREMARYIDEPDGDEDGARRQ